MATIKRKTREKTAKKKARTAEGAPDASTKQATSAPAPLKRDWTAILEAAFIAVSKGESIKDLCEANPDWRLQANDVHLRIVEDDELMQRYLKCRRAGAMAMSEDILNIADDSRNDFMLKETRTGNVVEVPNPETVQRSKLRIDARMRLLEALDPSTFGKKLDLSNKDGSFASLWATALQVSNAPAQTPDPKTKH